MAEHRSTAEEAADPGTSPERLLELTEKHPQLHRLIVMNPSTPEVARQWILATNQWAKQAYETGAGASTDSDAAPDEGDEFDEGEPTQLHQAVPDEDPAPTEVGPASQEEQPPSREEPHEDASAGGEVPEELVWGTALGAGGPAAAGAAAGASADEPSGTTPPPAPPAQPTSVPPSQGQDSPSSVRLSPTASVVPLGAAAAGTAPASGPAPAPGPAPVHGPGTAPVPLGPPPTEQQDSDDGSRRKAWIACGGCLVLALILLAVIGLGARALLSQPEEDYQRDSTTTSTEAAPEETTPEETEETTSEDPVSPAPEGAEEMTELHSPTGNISCLLEKDSVSCSVVDRDFSEAGLEDCENGPFSITVAGEEAERSCGSSFLSDSAPALEYDDSATYGDTACTSRFDGMTCWNTMTGKGFTVNRVTYETF